MNIERALTVPGFMGEHELAYLAESASESSNILEIGSWSGRSARAFADNTLGTVTCVDTWADDAYGSAPADITCHVDWLWNEFQHNLFDCSHVIPWRMSSLDGAQRAAALGLRFDLIFIDGGHGYDDVKSDILAWRPLLVEGGILCGHDLYPDGPYHPGVLQAVNEIVNRYRVVDKTTIWTTEGA